MNYVLSFPQHPFRLVIEKPHDGIFYNHRNGKPCQSSNTRKWLLEYSMVNYLTDNQQYGIMRHHHDQRVDTPE